MKPLLLCLCLCLCSCDPDPDTPMNVSVPTQESRFIVTRVGVIEDPLAYNSRRGIYTIKDTITGKEFVGVSGVGVSELGSHNQTSEKTTHHVPDER